MQYRFSTDVHECLEERNVSMVVNSYCRDAGCRKFVQLASTYQGRRHKIGIITVDNRAKHRGHEMWARYAAAHEYVYIKEKPQADNFLLQDWSTTGKLLEVLENSAFRHIDLFMYTELDQWPVRPLALLEPVFEQTGLISGNRMISVVKEYPCENIRNGGRFNMGNFLFRRDNATKRIFREWQQSKSYKDSKGIPHWPARQGAFTVDIYPRHRRSISTLENGCPLGSPFGSLVGHMTSGNIDSLFDYQAGRHVLKTMLIDCVSHRLQAGDLRPCSVYPPWVSGRCMQCPGSLTVLRQPPFQEVTLEYDTCCGEDDSTLAVEMLDHIAGELLDNTGNVSSLKLGMLFPQQPWLPGFASHCKAVGGTMQDHVSDDLGRARVMRLAECEQACRKEKLCGAVAFYCLSWSQFGGVGLCFLKQKGKAPDRKSNQVCFKPIN